MFATKWPYYFVVIMTRRLMAIKIRPTLPLILYWGNWNLYSPGFVPPVTSNAICNYTLAKFQFSPKISAVFVYSVQLQLISFAIIFMHKDDNQNQIKQFSKQQCQFKYLLNKNPSANMYSLYAIHSRFGASLFINQNFVMICNKWNSVCNVRMHKSKVYSNRTRYKQ